MLKNSLLVGFLAFFAAPRLYIKFRNLPVYENPEPWFHMTNIWTESELSALRQLVLSQPDFHTAAEDVTTKVLEVSRDVLPDGSCPHKYLSKQKTGDKCILPGRIDIFTHYAKTGGKYGAKAWDLQFYRIFCSFICRGSFRGSAAPPNT